MHQQLHPLCPSSARSRTARLASLTALAVLTTLGGLAGCATQPASPSAPVVTAPISSAPAVAQPTLPPPAADTSNPMPTAVETARQLPAFRWRLSEATRAGGRPVPGIVLQANRPLYLVFEPTTGRIAASGGCNRMGGSYTVTPAGLLRVSQWMGTRMACEPALMQLDAALAAFLGSPVRLAAEGGPEARGVPPRLVLTATDQTRLVFTGEPTAETRYGGTPEIIFLEVAPRRVPCAHPLMPNATCLQVRERRFDAAGLSTGAPGAWQALHGEIEGFTPTDGMRQVLRVKRFQRAQPLPSDQSSTALVLDMVIESTLAPR
ncbi:MAG: hypothetical protein JWQ88_2143 [Rhodoferax sp.]|nr:hypothetical protein [Rhodoferax sp.]